MSRMTLVEVPVSQNGRRPTPLLRNSPETNSRFVRQAFQADR
jgi:hypothetical protein